MERVSGIADMRARVRAKRREGRRIALVPTMGALHAGHLSLVYEGRKWADCVVMSVYVNPMQFGPSEDLARYPRDVERDAAMAEKAGVDLFFVPSDDEMYPDGYQTTVDVGQLRGTLTKGLCGAARPGHFRGVATVVTKLLHIVHPDVALFGQKDAQQLLVLRRLVEDLNMEVEIIGVPTVREPDGLAMSSRNAYLSSEERRAAPLLHRSLTLAQRLIVDGERDAETVKAAMRECLGQEPLIDVEYVSVSDRTGLRELGRVDGHVLIAVAARLGRARLIDNVMLDVADEAVRERALYGPGA